MGLFTRKEEHEDENVLDIEIIERSENPDDLPSYDYELVGRDGKRMKDALSGDEGDDPESGAEVDVEGDTDCEASRDGGAGLSDDEDVRDGDDALLGSETGVPFMQRSFRAPLVGAALAVALVVGGVLGYVASNGFGVGTVGATSLTEDQLDQTVASYTYKGAKKSISAREVLTSQYTSDASKNEDGSYVVPSAENTVAYARNRILVDEAQARGISVDDDEMESYAQEMLGSSDYEALGELYGISTDDAKEIVRESCMTSKLYEQVVADQDEAPAAPTSPDDGDEQTASAEYGAYIVALLGDEWDAEGGDWARTDGSFYAALGEEEFSADSATYEQAYTAYSVAYSTYMSNANEVWTNFANELFSRASVSLYSVGV